MNTIADELDIAVGSITPDLTPDQVAEVRCKVAAFMERAKELKAACDAAMVEYITATGQPIVIGPVRFYVGEKKETKCVDQVDALQSLLELFGHDHVAKQFLASGAFKHGAIKKEVDAETYARLFVVETKQKLEEGVAVKQLQQIDERWVK